jgi:hypothetical protein
VSYKLCRPIFIAPTSMSVEVPSKPSLESVYRTKYDW